MLFLALQKRKVLAKGSEVTGNLETGALIHAGFALTS
jgi:hypothetical protein